MHGIEFIISLQYVQYIIVSARGKKKILKKKEFKIASILKQVSKVQKSASKT